MAEDLAPSAGKIRVKISCPLNLIADVEVDSLEVPALQGSRLILPHRAPLFCQLTEGRVILHRQDKPDITYLISKGVCEVRRDICALMGWAIAATELDKTEIRENLSAGEKILSTLPTGSASQALRDRLHFYKLLADNSPLFSM